MRINEIQLYNTGVHVAQIIGVRVADVVLDGVAYMSCWARGGASKVEGVLLTLLLQAASICAA